MIVLSSIFVIIIILIIIIIRNSGKEFYSKHLKIPERNYSIGKRVLSEEQFCSMQNIIRKEKIRPLRNLYLQKLKIHYNSLFESSDNIHMKPIVISRNKNDIEKIGKLNIFQKLFRRYLTDTTDMQLNGDLTLIVYLVNNKNKIIGKTILVPSVDHYIKAGILYPEAIWYGKKKDHSINIILNWIEKSINTFHENISIDELLKIYNINEYIINDDNSVNVNQSVTITDASIRKIPIKFNKIKGDFIVKDCINLRTVDKFPKEVTGNFEISYTKIRSLIGMPKIVGGDIECYSNFYLKSLEGMPETIKGNFICNKNNALTSLKGSPKHVSGNFECKRCTSLITLKGSPKRVDGNVMYIQKYDFIDKLEGAPEYVGGDFKIFGFYYLTDLLGAPKYIGGDFEYHSLILKTTEGMGEVKGKIIN